MTILSSVEQELIRTRPQISSLNLVMFEPRIIFQAQVNDNTITKGARVITYDTVSLGSFSAIEANFTLLVGTSAGAQDIGRIRVRSATSTQITVSENSNINWADRLFLTVLRYVELWPIYPRIIQNPSNPEDVIFYKDYDIAYTNQNSILGTFPNAGPHRPVLINNLTGTAYYSSTGTFNPLGHSLTYNWSFEGGTPTGSSSADPGNVYYYTSGNYVTRLIITDATNGATDTTYRYVAVRNKIGQGSNTPIVRWKMDELTGSRSEGGYSTKFTLYDTTSIDANAIVMLVSDDWFGNTNTSLGGNYPNAGQIFFVGYINKDSIRYDYEISLAEFEAVSLVQLMKETLGFSVSVESKVSPSKWYELIEMDVRRAIYHYLRWHTTVLNIADFEFKGTDYAIQYFDSDRTSIYDAIDSLIRSTLVGEVVSDRQGKIWAEVSAMAYPNPTGSFPSRFDITNRDWKDMPTLEETTRDDYSYIELGGILYNGPTLNTFSAMLTCAPGSAPSFSGKVERLQGLALGSQSQLNTMAGNIFATRNSRYPTVEMNLTANFRNFDIAPQEAVLVSLAAGDTVRNVAISKVFLPENVTWRYYPESQLLLPNIMFKNFLNGFAGDTIFVPDPEDLTDGTGFEIPNPTVPIIFPPLHPIPTVPPSSTSNVVVILVPAKGVYYTTDFTADSPHWFSMNSGIDDPVNDLLWTLEITSSGRLFLQSAQDCIYTAPSIGGTWTKVITAAQIQTMLPNPFNLPGHVNALGINRGAADEGMILAGVGATAFAYHTYLKLTSAGVTLATRYDIAPSFPVLQTAGYMYYGNEQWASVVPSWEGFYCTTNREASAVLTQTNLGNGAASYKYFIRNSQEGQEGFIWGLADATKIKKTLDNGTSFTDCAVMQPIEDIVYGLQSVGADDTGMFLMGGHTAGILTYRSSDGGASWGAISVLSGSTKAVWSLSASQFIIGFAGMPYYTDDFGTSWKNKVGDLWTYTGSSPSISCIRTIKASSL